MRKGLLAILVAVLFAAGYVAYPLYAAWSIREAMRDGNSGHLASAIEWDTVRATLGQSLKRIALKTSDGVEEPNAEAPQGLWNSIKASVSNSAVDRLVATYVTPQRLPQLFTLRQVYRNYVPTKDEVADLPWHERLAHFWGRIKRAEFHSLTAFEIEMADRQDPNRHYVGILSLRGLTWKLTELRVRVRLDASSQA